jgi:hypothetical protein
MSNGQMLHPADAEFPVNGSPRQRLGFAANFASLSPAQFARQSFELLLADTHLDLVTREDPASDPGDSEKRSLMIECGKVLHHLKVALRHFGCLGRVEYFPDLDRRSLAARIHFGFGRERDADDAAQFEALTQPGNRSSSDAREVSPEAMFAAFGRTHSAERAWLELTRSQTSLHRVLEFTLANEPARPFADSTSLLGVVKTKTDDEHGWLAAGQAAARASLQAQAWGLPWDFLDHVPHRNAREALRTGIGYKGFAQIILRFGPTINHTLHLQSSRTSTATFDW